MKEYTCIIALAVILCLLIAICCLYLRFRRIKKTYSSNLIRNIREQDRMARELEQTRLEKETIEKVLEKRLTVTAGPPPDDGTLLRIDITTLKTGNKE